MIEAMKGRDLFISTACGPSDFSHAEEEKREAEVRKFLPIIEALGRMKAVGLIICPARSKPGLGLWDGLEAPAHSDRSVAIGRASPVCAGTGRAGG